MPNALNPQLLTTDSGGRRLEVVGKVTEATVLQPIASGPQTQLRCFSCDCYRHCIEVAIENRWAGFDCRECPSAGELQEVATAARPRSTVGVIRQEIIEVLAEAGPLTVKLIIDRIGREGTTIRQALSIARRLGIVQTTQKTKQGAKLWRLTDDLGATVAKSAAS